MFKLAIQVGLCPEKGGKQMAKVRKQRRWTKREIAMLGKAPDVEIAKFIGRSQLAVRQR
jgi:hypothetical protein